LEPPVKITRLVAAGGACSVALFFNSPVSQAAQFRVLHSFSDPAFSVSEGGFYGDGGYDGSGPHGNLTIDGSRIYGVTQFGGFNYGTVFGINTTGTDYQVLHRFDDGDPNIGLEGRQPQGGLYLQKSFGPEFPGTLSGAVSYGTHREGGALYSVATDGSSFQHQEVFHGPFNAFDSSGAYPNGDLIGSLDQSANVSLVGTSARNGSTDNGALFGLGVPAFFSLPGGAGGGIPKAGLVKSAGTYFGTVSQGGASNNGAVFAIDQNAVNYRILHSFGGGADGGNPTTKLTVIGSKLFGTTDSTIFSMNLDGTGYRVLRNLGAKSSLTAAGSKFFGVSFDSVYSIKMDGTAFEILHKFVNPAEGVNPDGGVIVDGPWLYGTTLSGGEFGGGTVFVLAIPEPSSFILATLGIISCLVWAGRRGWGGR
jgi:hypothetical protein